MGRPAEVLIVEDDAALARLMRLHLERAGLRCAVVHDGAEARARLEDSSWRLVVLDRMLPGMRGMALLRWMRADARHRHTPVLVVTALGQPCERIAGLEAGADDYLPKPFEPAELVARVRALLRRAEAASTPATGQAHTPADLPALDADAFAVHWRGAHVRLRPLEFRLLAALLDPPGRTRSRTDLLAQVWDDAEIDPRTVDVTIKRLRQAIDPLGLADRIETIRGAGYRFRR